MNWIATAAAAIAVLWAWGARPRRVGRARGRGNDAHYGPQGGEPAKVLRIATFNIHGGRGRDGRCDPSRAARDLVGVDVAALQEVHNTWRRPRQHDDLAARLGLGVLYAPTRSRWFRRHRGNALLSRYPVAEWVRVPLAHGPGQGHHFRNLTVARLEPGRPLYVLFTHLNRQGGRAGQLEHVMQEFLKRSPAVLMGDLNMTRDDPALRGCLDRGDVVDALGETLANDDPERIDWILCRGLAVVGGGVVDSGASDHPLYWCDIEIP